MAHAPTVLDQQHDKQLQDPEFDPKAEIETVMKNALIALVHAISLADNHPNRVVYADMLTDLHAEDDDPLSAMIETAAEMLRETRTGNADD